MNGPLRVLADDLTGALDTAAVFAGQVPVRLDQPAADDTAAISVVATATRDIAPAELPAALAPALPWLQAAGLAYKKVDSLLRGNTVAEIRHLANNAGFERVLVAPAFPQQGRWMQGGRLWVRGQAQPGAPLQQALAGCAVPVLCPDIDSDEALLRLADAATTGPRTLYCGSAGLAQALAQVLGLRAALPTAPALADPVLMVSASRHAVVQRQWQRLRGAGLRRAGLSLHNLSPEAALAAAEAAALLARQTQALVVQLPRPATLVVVGGDTLRALCLASGVQHLQARAAAEPGWGLATLCGGLWHGTVVHARSGAFGDDEDLLRKLRG